MGVRDGVVDWRTFASCCENMRLAPKRCGDDQRIDRMALPPGALVTTPVEFAVVQSANGHREPVTDFPAHRPLLGKLDVVGI